MTSISGDQPTLDLGNLGEKFFSSRLLFQDWKEKSCLGTDFAAKTSWRRFFSTTQRQIFFSFETLVTPGFGFPIKCCH